MKRNLTLIIRYSNQITFIFVLILFGLTAVLGLMNGGQLRYPDEHDYSQLAYSITNGNGYVNPEGKPTAYRPPGWPFILSLVYRFFPHPWAAKLFNAFVYAGAAWLLSIMAARITPEGKIFAPLLLLLYPVGIYTASTLYPQASGTLLLVAILLLLDNQKHAAFSSSAAGLLFGLLVLSIPAFLLITPLILIGMLLASQKKSTFLIARSLLFLTCAALIIIPWTVRNTRVLGGFTPVSTNSGVNLLLGNSENTGPNSGVNVD
ncbi:MAG: hypothetical protein D3924_00715, partial [Candidatus Electrothrix sp. AR4]|nr:hypothetical protein [Candidatus Electrothrix sp. AR4]